jgi:GH35 family endo-1,4-beta-xylanase
MKTFYRIFVIGFFTFFAFPVTMLCQIPAGGTEIIKEPLANAFKVGGNDKITMTKVTIADQLFTTAFHLTSSSTVVNSWDVQLSFPPATAIVANDVILVAFYARTTASLDETGLGSLVACLENKTTYAKLTYQRVSIATEWKQYFVPLKSTVALLANNLNCAIHLGFPSQTIEIADVHFINYAGTKTLEELPVTEITYVGREADAPWRAEADERISQIRKGNIQITLVDSTGAVVPNAEVTIGMTQHKFKFGSAVTATNYLTNPTYKQKVLELFNEVVFENDLKWPTFSTKTAAQKTDMINVLKDLESRNITMRGHNVIWPSYKYNSAFLANYKTQPDKLRFEIDKHIDDVCTFTKGRLVDWDVINEPYTEHEFMDLLGKESMADWFKRVRNNDPTVKLYLNDFAILSSNGTNFPKQDSYMETVRYIDGLGGGVQGIGFQGHFGSDLTPITRLKTILDKFSVLEKEIKVTEFDVVTTQEAVKAEYTRDFYTMLFSHPSVVGILMWGFWEKSHWEPTAAMYAADWSIRANGQAYKDLVLDKWWTKDTTQITNETGVVNFNGFLGTYKYIVKYDGKELVGSFEVLNPVSGGVSNEIILSTHPDVPAEIEIKVTGSTVLCEGSTTNLGVTAPESFTINWYHDDVELAETTPSILVDKAGSYFVKISGKGVTLQSPPVDITINPIPEVSIDSSGILTFCAGGSVKLNTGIESQRTYKWYKNSVFFMGSTPEITVLESGKYKVEANSFGCKSMSPELTVTKRSAIDPLCSNGIALREKQLSVSPNPFQKSIVIEASGFSAFPVKIDFIDVNGKVVYHSEISDPSKTEIIPEINNGVYFLKMQADNKVQWVKVIKQS